MAALDITAVFFFIHYRLWFLWVWITIPIWVLYSGLKIMMPSGTPVYGWVFSIFSTAVLLKYYRRGISIRMYSNHRHLSFGMPTAVLMNGTMILPIPSISEHIPVHGGFSNADLQLMFPHIIYRQYSRPLPDTITLFTKQNTVQITGRNWCSGPGFAAGNFTTAHCSSTRHRLNSRVQPWGNFSVEFEQDELRFRAHMAKHPLPGSPRAEVNFSNNLFWTTFLQYNTQADNFNITAGCNGALNHEWFVCGIYG